MSAACGSPLCARSYSGDVTSGPRPRLRAGLAAVDEAARLDARLPPTEWNRLPEGASRVGFQAPSGLLAGFTLGDPAAQRIVLVPGATGSKEDFLLLAPLLARAGYRVESFDLAGQYESASAGPSEAGRYDYALFVDDLIAVLESAGPAHLLGYSFAGIVAQLATVRRPDLISSLTLLTTPPVPGHSLARVRFVGWLSRLSSARVAASLMIWGIVTNKNRVDELRLSFVRDRLDITRRSSVDEMVGLMREVPDLRAGLRELGIPALVAVGIHDLWPLRLHARFATSIGARMVVYRTGHSPCETAPNQLARDMLGLIRSAPRRL